MTPSDLPYKQAKMVKLGRTSISFPFVELANWISQKFNVNVLTITYDKVKQTNAPRLTVVHEFSKDDAKFNDSSGYWNKEIQNAVAEKFAEIVQNEISKSKNLFQTFFGIKLEYRDLLVTFASFESAAKIEANETIPNRAIKKLEQEFVKIGIWKIARFLSTTTFFYHTDQQLKAASEEQKRSVADKYYLLLKEKDPFNYFSEKNFSVFFDSKENFDNSFQGNWYYYYK